MIITEPNKFVAEVHDRMPVLLEEKQFDAWLDDRAIPASLVNILKPAAAEVLSRRPISTRIKSSRTSGDDPTLVDQQAL
jgi:putative SOS response-associated peptidase YedK